MKKLAIIIAVGGLIGTPAFAQAPPPPTLIYPWIGLYIGGNLGASFGHVNTDFNAPATVQASVAVFSGGVQTASGSGSFSSSLGGSNTEVPSGFIGGGQIGYNLQLSPILVVGVEGDFQGALERDGITLPPNNFSQVLSIQPLNAGNPVGSPIPVSVTGSTALAYQTKIDWFGTARARAGYLFGDGMVMTYLTGGLAYGRVGLDGTSTTNATASLSGVTTTPANIPLSVSQSFGHSQNNTGWTVGSGTEGRLLIPGWTYKIEYLYVDLGSLDVAGLGGSAAGGPICSPSPCTSSTQLTANLKAGPVTTHSHFTDNIIRIGVNYLFH